MPKIEKEIMHKKQSHTQILPGSAKSKELQQFHYL